MQMESVKKACKISGGFETYCTSHFFLLLIHFPNKNRKMANFPDGLKLI